MVLCPRCKNIELSEGMILVLCPHCGFECRRIALDAYAGIRQFSNQLPKPEGPKPLGNDVPYVETKRDGPIEKPKKKKKG